MSTIAKFLAQPPNGFSTQIASATVAANALSVTLDSTTGLPTEGIGQFFKKDANGDLIAGSVEFVHWTNVSGNTITFSDTNDRGITGSDSGAQSYVADDYFEVWVSSYYVGGYGGLVEHDADGTHNNAKVVTVSSNDGQLPAAASNIQVNGADPKRAIYIPASGMFPATTAGCAAVAQAESSTNKINYKVLDFDASTEEYACFHMPAPSYWDLSTVTAEFHWTAASGTGDVIWGIAGLARSNDDALDTALGTAVTVTDTLIAAGDQHLSADSGAITIGGTPAKDDHLFFRVYRDADAGGDTLNADARLIGVTIRFGVSQFSDE